MNEQDSGAASRADAMGERVVRTARDTGPTDTALPLLARAYQLAMEPRLRLGIDDHDPDFLHPGRTALILLLDTQETRPGVLAAAMLTETGRSDLRVDPSRIELALGGAFGADVRERVAAVPPTTADDLAERLVLAADDVQLVALAERLDYLRHAHLWSDVERRRAAHALATEVYAGLAHRVHPALARRYDAWCGMFERKYLR